MSEHNQENDSNSLNLGMLFRRAARFMLRGHHHRHGMVHPAQGRILFLLKEKGQMNRKDLLELLEVRSGSLSELLGKLERQGYITRIRDEIDKRGFIVELTEKGAEIVSEYETWAQEKSKVLFSSLSDEEKQQLGDILTKLAKTWEDELCRDEYGYQHLHCCSKRVRQRQHQHRREGRGERRSGAGRYGFSGGAGQDSKADF